MKPANKPPVTYSRESPYVGQYRQAYADVVLIYNSQNTWPIMALVDTGADYLQLPVSAAAQVGLQVVGTPIGIITASGRTPMTLMKNLVVEIEGTQVTTDILFTSRIPGRPLLGRQALFALKEIGFDIRAWYAK